MAKQVDNSKLPKVTARFMFPNYNSDGTFNKEVPYKQVEDTAYVMTVNFQTRTMRVRTENYGGNKDVSAEPFFEKFPELDHKKLD